jgi:hypothetical protein
MHKLVQTSSPDALRDYGLGLAVGTIPLVLSTILLFRLSLPSPAFVNTGFSIYPLLALFVYGIEVLGTILCLFLKRLRPFGAGGLTMLVFSLCVWQAILPFLIRD